MAADQHVLARQAIGPGKCRDIAQQVAKRFAYVVLRVILRPQCGEQIIDPVSDRIADQAFPWSTGTAEGDADFAEMTLGVVLAEDFHLRAGVAVLLAEESSAGIDLAVIAQLSRSNGRPAGLLHRLQRGFFRIRIPWHAGDDALGIGAANQRGDQRRRQAKAKAVVLVTGGKAVIEVVIGIQRDRHGVGEQRL